MEVLSNHTPKRKERKRKEKKWRSLLAVKALFFLLLLYSGLPDLNAQQDHITYRYEDGNVIATFDHLQDTFLLNSLLAAIGSSWEITDSLNLLERNKKTALGWELIHCDDNKIEYQKTIKSLAAHSKSNYHFEENVSLSKESAYDLDVEYGKNLFKQNSIITKGDDIYSFRLLGFPNAKKVNLASSFNNWSTIKTTMVKEGDAWVTTLKLSKGKHLYKFVVDGEWMTDPSNALEENDHHGNTNSVFYNYNYTFLLEGYSTASNIFLAGDFNDWNPTELRMIRNNNGWELPMYLKDGIHQYKFVVDGKWMLDPENNNTRPDGNGNVNNVLTLGEPIIFQIPDFENAKKVALSGNFVGWDKNGLPMTRKENAWTVPIVLQPGNYEYKFVVDGKWKLDANNPHTIGRGNFKNAVYSVEPNYTFVLKGYDSAKEVLLSGTFNDWSTSGYTMERKFGQWEITIHLPKGKTRYKFIIDGKWIEDPVNPLWEKNQFDSKDSILWVE